MSYSHLIKIKLYFQNSDGTCKWQYGTVINNKYAVADEKDSITWKGRSTGETVMMNNTRIHTLSVTHEEKSLCRIQEAYACQN